MQKFIDYIKTFAIIVGIVMVCYISITAFWGMMTFVWMMIPILAILTIGYFGIIFAVSAARRKKVKSQKRKEV
jgi:uncharacterized protein YacL